jgi:hypothetical protein
LAMEDPQRAQDALVIMSELYAQDPTNPMVVRPDSASYTAVIEGWCYTDHSHKHLSYQEGGGSRKNHQHGDDDDDFGDDEIRDRRGSGSSNEKNSEGGYNNSKNNNDNNNNNQITRHHYAAQKAQALLDIMESTCAKDGWLCPNDLSYLLVCQQWAESTKNDPMGRNAQKAHDILTRLQGRQPSFGATKTTAAAVQHSSTSDTIVNGSELSSSTDAILPPLVVANVKIYIIVLEAWCRRVGKVPYAMRKAEQVLRDLEEASLKLPVALVNESYNAAANLSTARTDEGGTTTVSNSTTTITNKVRPNVLTYTSVIGALSRSRERNLASRAQAMLERMKQYGVEPDMVAYTSVLNCWAKAVSREERGLAAKKAFQILKEMEDLYILEEQYHVKPNAITYATAIKAIGNSLDPEAPALAEQVLQRMYALTESGKIHVPPTAGTYNSVITSLSSSRGCSSAQKLANAKRAEHLLVDMIKRSRNQKEAMVEPNVRTWGAVLRAWAESGQPDAGVQAQRVLDQMQEWYNQGKTLIRPNVVCFTTVMHAWGRCYPQRDPNVAMERVDQLLRTMEEMYEQTLEPDVRPNKITYVTAIDAICRNCPKDKTGSKAQEIVDRMMRLYSKGIGHDRPTRIVLNALLNAWSRSTEPNAASKAEQIFQWMETQYRAGDDFVKPDEVSLCCVLNAWANTAQQDPGAALRAQQILDYTESLTVEERGFCHSIICHNIVIKAWGRSRSPDSVQRAEAILNSLEEKGYNVNKNNHGERQNPQSIRPDVTTYSSVINCCAYYVGGPKGRQTALEVALQTFEKVLQRQNQFNQNQNVWNATSDNSGIGRAEDGPNHIAYGTLFKAIAKLLDHHGYLERPPGVGIGLSSKKEKHQWSKNELVKHYFQQCCQQGQVDGFVLSQVKAASTFELYRQLVLVPASSNKTSPTAKGQSDRDSHSTSIDALLRRIPSEWTRHVVD